MDKKKIKPPWGVNSLNSDNPKSERIIYALLLMIVAIIPILERVVIIGFSSPLISNTMFESGSKYDLSTYYKFLGLTIAAILLLGVFLYKIIREGYRIPKNYTTIPLAVFFIIILASGFFAEYKTISLIGQFNFHEGTITYIIYLFLFLLASGINYHEKRAKWLYYALYPLVLINFFLIVSYFYDIDVTKISILHKILIPAGINNSFTIRSTLFNPNFLSGMAGMLTIIFLAKAILIKDRKIKFLDMLFCLFSFTMLLAATSTSGFLTVVVLWPFLILLIFLSKRWKEGIITLLIAIFAFGMIFTVLYNHNSLVWDESLGLFISRQSFFSDRDNKITTTEDPVAKKNLELKYQSDKDFGLPSWGKSAGNGRVYIWQKTAGLVAKHPILGYGLDTLTYYFPQDDPAKYTGMGAFNIIIDEPHNMYLNIAYGSGVFALAAFLVIIGRHFWYNIKLLRKPLDSPRRIIIASMFGGWCAFLVQGLFNNSLIGTMPVFWILFGASVSMVREELKNSAI